MATLAASLTHGFLVLSQPWNDPLFQRKMDARSTDAKYCSEPLPRAVRSGETTLRRLPYARYSQEVAIARIARIHCLGISAAMR